MGRPPKFNSADSLDKAIVAYFKQCTKKYEMPNKAGLCLSLRISRETYSEYHKKYPDTIKKANETIENAWVQRLQTNSPVGAIFYLKNAFKESYKDRHESDVTVRTPQPLLANALLNNNSNEKGTLLKGKD